MGRAVCTEPQCVYKGDLYLFYLWTECRVIALNPYSAVGFNGLCAKRCEIF